MKKKKWSAAETVVGMMLMIPITLLGVSIGKIIVGTGDAFDIAQIPVQIIVLLGIIVMINRIAKRQKKDGSKDD